MSSISIRRVVAAGLGVAVVLAFIPTVHSQRPVEPAASASAAAVRPADSPAVFVQDIRWRYHHPWVDPSG